MPEITLLQVLSQRRTVRDFSDATVPLQVLERLLWAGQGITGADGKRTAPSAHAIHPLQLYLASSRIDGLDKGLYKVDPVDHSLVQTNGTDVRMALTTSAIDEPQWMMDAACIIIICADMVTPGQTFADQKPFGRRAQRYVYLEAGATAQNIQLQAVAEGLGSVWVGGFDDDATAKVLSLPEHLAPIIHVCVGYP